MSKLDQLRQKKLQRQAQAAANGGLEALLDGAGGIPVASATAMPAVAVGTSNGNGLPPSSIHSTKPLEGAARNPDTSSLPPPPPFAADSFCPTSLQELQSCVVRFICGSPAFGPLPVSGVGLNAALRREYMRAGHPRTSLSVFRAADTVASLRAIQQQLQASHFSDALVLEDSAGGDDLLIVEADGTRIASVLLRAEIARGSGNLAKRARLDSSGHHAALVSHSSQVFISTSHAATSSTAMVPVASQGSGGRSPPSGVEESVEDLLSAPTARQRQRIDAGDELRELLAEPTARQSLTAQKFMNKSRNMAQFCPCGSRADCRASSGFAAACSKIHFKKIIKPWTDESLGDCSYLDTCRHIEKCKYVHYALDLTMEQTNYLNECGVQNRGTDTKRINELAMKGMEIPAQWVQCDLRKFPLEIFKGRIDVVMADPPWDIHMELPYGTLTDDEVRNLRVGDIHEHGMIFLWVTGRAMELARDCFRIWGYKRIEEIIWVKTNQLQRIIRTGRTGHWINHSKEHCLVGIKGNPKLNKNIDCDVIVSEVRETSRKPDEIYNLIERMFPNCQKLELFGRPHNIHDNWVSLGNQLDGVRLVDEEIVKRYNQEYPDKPTQVYSRPKNEVMAFDGGVSSSSLAGENAPWKPPSQAPIPEASSSGAWVPPSQGAAPQAWTPPPPNPWGMATPSMPPGPPSGLWAPPTGAPPAWGWR
eukprot:TRINITY_DN8823_c0_g1_i1.p1 TRINITY_DN8823_c0_g1~~TRINITY_DN8823_c0_g1_i1.p1  ORF type:complete len:704 (+),score=119.74 TRINITY_DN8823_c0_g1_i1:68-2179(+)